MLAIARSGVTLHAAGTEAPKRSAPNLDAQMRTARAQLADWVTCPSAKTPQGKEKIKQISEKLASIKNEIKVETQKPDTAASVHQDYLAAPNRAGANVDTYA